MRMQILDFSWKIRRSGNSGLVFLPGSSLEIKRASTFYLGHVLFSCARLPPLPTSWPAPSGHSSSSPSRCLTCACWSLVWSEQVHWVKEEACRGPQLPGGDLTACTVCGLLCQWACFSNLSCPEEIGAGRNASIHCHFVSALWCYFAFRLVEHEINIYGSTKTLLFCEMTQWIMAPKNPAIASCYGVLCHLII